MSLKTVSNRKVFKRFWNFYTYHITGHLLAAIVPVFSGSNTESTTAIISSTSTICKQRLTWWTEWHWWRCAPIVKQIVKDMIALLFSLHCVWWHWVWKLYAERLEASVAAEEWHVWVLSESSAPSEALLSFSFWCIVHKSYSNWGVVTILQASVQAKSSGSNQRMWRSTHMW